MHDSLHSKRWITDQIRAMTKDGMEGTHLTLGLGGRGEHAAHHVLWRHLLGEEEISRRGEPRRTLAKVHLKPETTRSSPDRITNNNCEVKTNKWQIGKLLNPGYDRGILIHNWPIKC